MRDAWIWAVLILAVAGSWIILAETIIHDC